MEFYRYDDIIRCHRQTQSKDSLDSVKEVYVFNWGFRLALLERVAKILTDLHGKRRCYGKLRASKLFIANSHNYGLERLDDYPIIDGLHSPDRDMEMYGILALQIYAETIIDESLLLSFQPEHEPVSLLEQVKETVNMMYEYYMNPSKQNDDEKDLFEKEQLIKKYFLPEGKYKPNWLKPLEELILDCIMIFPKPDAKKVRKAIAGIIHSYETYILKCNGSWIHEFAFDEDMMKHHGKPKIGESCLYSFSDISSLPWEDGEEDLVSHNTRAPLKKTSDKAEVEKLSATSGREQKKAIGIAKLLELLDAQTILEESIILNLLLKARSILSSEPNILEIEAPVIVVGDIHGQYYDLRNMIVKIKENKKTDKLLFLGDYVDRGKFSCETLLYLLRLKIEYPEKVYLLRGNHESDALASVYGFRGEVDRKYGRTIYSRFLSVFQALPLACIIKAANIKPFIALHGGISDKVQTLNDIKSVNRFVEPPLEGTLCDMLWSDPVSNSYLKLHDLNMEFEDLEYLKNEVRGCATTFGYKAVSKFLSRNKLSGIIRAHEMKEEGYEFQFENFGGHEHVVVTVFSAPNYMAAHGNKGAYLLVHNTSKNSDEYRPTSYLEPFPFSEVINPPVKIISHENFGLHYKINHYCPYMPKDIEEFHAATLDMLEYFGVASEDERFGAKLYVDNEDKARKSSRHNSRESSFSSGSTFLSKVAKARNDETAHELSVSSTKRSNGSFIDELHPEIVKERLRRAENRLRTGQDAELVSTIRLKNSRDLKIGNTSFAQKEIETIELMFFSIDKTDTGQIGVAQLQKWAQDEGFVLEEQDARGCISAIDYDGDEYIGINDFFKYAAKLKEDWEITNSRYDKWDSDDIQSSSESGSEWSNNS